MRRAFLPLEVHPPHDAKNVRTVYADEGRDVELSFIATDAPSAGTWRKQRAIAMVGAEGSRVVVRQLREGSC